jgi:hypothetical protein
MRRQNPDKLILPPQRGAPMFRLLRRYLDFKLMIFLLLPLSATAERIGGFEIAADQAYWLAWYAFHPDTAVFRP